MSQGDVGPAGIDSYDLNRFVQAQDPVYAAVRAELTAGYKRSHWMWFIFPQFKALGRSATAKHFGIEGADEALAYWRHPVLGARLLECARLVLAVQGKSADNIFGFPDDVKLRSCMTLFEAVAQGERIFGQILDRYFEGQRDEQTIRLLG